MMKCKSYVGDSPITPFCIVIFLFSRYISVIILFVIPNIKNIFPFCLFFLLKTFDHHPISEVTNLTQQELVRAADLHSR